jgi:hypothetical protein
MHIKTAASGDDKKGICLVFQLVRNLNQIGHVFA